ncbi:tellurite resistance/C4-dicarboxylate transporter family protein [Streptomyces sp. NPDC005898]|uniref:tellurite resistance/C4-dicarboxylate transporter family protein n=1 Tax=Streptomyces sp. NPDC005898 TaxID=3157082 RepID=UPI0033C3AB2E
MREELLDRCRRLPPACFAPVMATGIVSRAVAQAGAPNVSRVLFAIAVASYLVLLTGTALKARCHRATLRAELRDPARLFGHFTLVAASGVLATRLGAGPLRYAAHVLLFLAALVWLLLARAVGRSFVRAAPGAEERAIAGSGTGGGQETPGPRAVVRRADGSWFLATVGLQALGLALTGPHPDHAVLTLALVLWSAGSLLYAATLALVVRRLRHQPPPAAELTPAYWVTMGAAAISTLAGARLLAHGDLLPGAARAFLAVAVLALWAWATLLIPLLLAAGIWRHLRHRIPLTYEPALWTIVFPLGMYATATTEITAVEGGKAFPLSPHPLAWLALTAWTAVTARCLGNRLPAQGRRVDDPDPRTRGNLLSRE